MREHVGDAMREKGVEKFPQRSAAEREDPARARAGRKCHEGEGSGEVHAALPDEGRKSVTSKMPGGEMKWRDPRHAPSPRNGEWQEGKEEEGAERRRERVEGLSARSCSEGERARREGEKETCRRRVEELQGGSVWMERMGRRSRRRHLSALGRKREGGIPGEGMLSRGCGLRKPGGRNP